MLAPCDGWLEVGVLVKDPSGAAISDVHVAVLDHPGETDTNGCVKIEGMFHPASIFRDPDVTLSAERTGYKPLHAHRRLGLYRIDVTLRPADSAQPSSAVWTTVASDELLDCTGDAP